MHPGKRRFVEDEISFSWEQKLKNLIKKLDAEYAFGLTEEEIELIARQAEESARLYQKLYDVDIADESPVSKSVAGEKE